jgi:hypothetical protein
MELVADVEASGALGARADAAKGLDQMTKKVRGRVFLEVRPGAHLPF